MKGFKVENNSNPQYIQVVSFEVKAYPATDKRKAGILGIVNAMVHQVGEKSFVGELLLPKDHPPVLDGKTYTAKLLIGKNFEGKLLGRVVALEEYIVRPAPKVV